MVVLRVLASVFLHWLELNLWVPELFIALRRHISNWGKANVWIDDWLDFFISRLLDVGIHQLIVFLLILIIPLSWIEFSSPLDLLFFWLRFFRLEATKAPSRSLFLVFIF